MKPRIALASAAVLALALGALLYASPHFTLRNMGKAVEARDAEAVAAYVDFPALRESVKAQVLARMASKLDKAGGGDNPFANVGKLLAAGMVNPLTDALVSPTGVMLMLKNGKPGQPADIAAAGVGVDTQTPAPRKDYVVDYQGWSEVFVHRKGAESGFVLRRDGLFTWKLAGIRMDTAIAPQPVD